MSLADTEAMDSCSFNPHRSVRRHPVSLRASLLLLHLLGEAGFYLILSPVGIRKESWNACRKSGVPSGHPGGKQATATRSSRPLLNLPAGSKYHMAGVCCGHWCVCSTVLVSSHDFWKGRKGVPCTVASTCRSLLVLSPP